MKHFDKDKKSANSAAAQSTGNSSTRFFVDNRSTMVCQKRIISAANYSYGKNIQSPSSAIQRKMSGQLLVNNNQFLAGLKNAGFNGALFSKIEGYKRTLNELDEDINSFLVAGIKLFPNDQSAIAAAKAKIEEIALKDAQEKEVARKSQALKDNFPIGTVGTYYRGDERTMEELADGFKGYKALTVEEARDMIKAWFEVGGHGPTACHQDWISNKTGGDKVATGNDIGCMGYGCGTIDGAVRNVYRIDIPNLREVELTFDVLGFQPHSEVASGKNMPKLLLNSDKLATATMIGVGGARAAETTFFTTIARDAITNVYQHTKGQQMPDRSWERAKGIGWVNPL